jgi:hypothetical protein
MEAYCTVHQPALLKEAKKHGRHFIPSVAEIKALRPRLNVSSRCSHFALLPYLFVVEYMTSHVKPGMEEELGKLLGTPSRIVPLEDTPLFQTRDLGSACPLEVLADCHKRASLIATGKGIVEDGTAIGDELEVCIEYVFMPINDSQYVFMFTTSKYIFHKYYYQ